VTVNVARVPMSAPPTTFRVEWSRLAMLKIRSQSRWRDPNYIADAHVGELLAFA
jgi:hypothetical protein